MIPRVAKRLQLSNRFQRYTTSVYHPPSLMNIPGRWESLPQPLKEEIQEYIDWQMKGDWQEMSLMEKQAAYYIGYGTWGPRSKSTKDSRNSRNSSNQQINIPYLTIRGLFNLALFSAVGVAVINWKRDKEVRDAAPAAPAGPSA